MLKKSFNVTGQILMIAAVALIALAFSCQGFTKKNQTAAEPKPEPAATPAPTVAKPAESKPPRPPFMGDKLTTESAALRKGEPGIVRLTWKTQSEENNFGFNVMRGKTENGPFEKINKEPILGAGNSSTENFYEYYDKNVKVGDFYYYFLQDISLGGRVSNYSPKLGRPVRSIYYAAKDPARTKE